METRNSYENYPIGTVMLSNLVSWAIYGLGFYLMYGLGLVFALLYLQYILILEFRLIRYHCTYCYYWGKTCGFGKGRISALLFKKGDALKFCSRSISWKSMIPDILVSLVPMTVGIILLIIKFNFVQLFALLLLVLLATTGSGYIRGKLTCSFCKQRELGCPAFQLFNKEKQPLQSNLTSNR